MIFIAVGFIVFFYLIVVIVEKTNSKKKHKNVKKIIYDSIPSDEKKQFIQSDEKKSTISASTERGTKQTSERDTGYKSNSNNKPIDNISRSSNQHGNISDRNDLDNDKVNKPKKIHKSEEECRVIIESIFKTKFPTKRPDFLNNPLSKKNLELDCYSEELGIALEYNGIQHYKYPNPFHRSESEFKKQLQRDEYKKEMCRINDVLLITIPYDMKKNKIRQHIIDRYNERLKMK